MPYRRFRQRLTFGYLLPFIVVMATLSAIVFWQVRTQISATGWVQHTDQVILRMKNSQLALLTIRGEVRNYLSAPDPSIKDTLGRSQREFTNELVETAALVTDNPDQERRLIKITELKADWIRRLAKVIDEKDRGQPSDDAVAEARDEGDALMTLMDEFIAVENHLREGRIAQQSRQTQLAYALVPFLSVLVVVVLSYWGWRQILVASEQFHDALTTAEQARLALERANQAKDAFLGTVSHELNNPLNSIMLWSGTLLTDSTLNPNTRRGLVAIERAVKAQARLVEDMLDVSRIEAGRLRLDVQNVNLADVVHAAVEGTRAGAEAKSITVQEIIDPRVDTVAGDAERLQQVVWNLMSNAVKFTPEGGRIQVRVERINSHLEISVADNGRGIDPVSLTSVFDRFWQAEAPAGGRRGVGLGLTIVKEIVALHGGTVRAHSEGLGKGATFMVRLLLPVALPTDDDSRRHPTVASASSATTPPRLDGVSLLVVDDDPEVCEALNGLLGSLGAKVTAVPSAKAALDVLDSVRPHVVISDIGMPVEDGYFLARRIREREQAAGTSRVPLVALTAYGRVEDKVQIMNAGFDRHAIKPVDPVELVTMLKTLRNEPKSV